MHEQAHFPVYEKPHKEFDCGNLSINMWAFLSLFLLKVKWSESILYWFVSLAFPSELLIIHSVLADQRAVCCYYWPDREALQSDQLWLKLKPGFNPRPFSCQATPSRRSPCLPWVSSCCALLDVTARQFRPFVHKSLYAWLPPPIRRQYLHALLWQLDMLTCVDTPAACEPKGKW